VPLAATLKVTVAISTCPALASVIATPENGLAVAASVVAILAVAGVIEIGSVLPVISRDVVKAVSPASATTAVAVVVTVPPDPTSFAVGVNNNPSSAAATAADDPDMVHTPFATWLPSVNAFGSDSAPLTVELSVTVTVVFCVGLAPLMMTPLNGVAPAAFAVTGAVAA
jgi:hypothetical protein